MKRNEVNNKMIVSASVAVILMTLLLGVSGVINAKIIFIINIGCMFLTIAYCQFSLISFASLLLNFPSVSLYLKYRGTDVYGVLQIFDNPFFKEQMVAVLISNFSIILWMSLTNYLEDEKKILSSEIFVSRASTVICCLGALTATIIRFPNISLTFSMETRFNTLLPGGAWNHVALVFMIFLWFSKEKVYPKLVVALCMFSFIIHFERVDVLGFIVAVMMIYFIKNNYKLNFKFLIKYVSVIFILLVGFLYLGELRENYQQDFMSNFIMKLLNQKTASDVSYTFVSSFNYVKDYGFENGRTLLFYIQNAIPLFGDANFDIAEILAYRYYTAYGSYLLNEPYINFGWLGIIIIPNMYMLVLRIIVKHKNPYTFILYFFVLACLFRIVWYGVSYIETGVIYIIPFVYLVVYLFNNQRSLKSKDGIS